MPPSINVLKIYATKIIAGFFIRNISAKKEYLNDVTLRNPNKVDIKLPIKIAKRDSQKFKSK